MDIKTTNQAVSRAFRAYMLKIYLYMSVGLLLTGVVAYFTAHNATMRSAVFQPPLMYIIMFAPFVFVLVLSFGINKLQAQTAQTLFWLFAAVMGLSLSSIFLVYTGVSIVRTFLVCSSMFLVMCIYGYTTKTDLSRFGSILLMALLGIIIASVVNIFLKSSNLEFAVSIIGVLVFAGLTAWDTQRIKLAYDEYDDREIASKKAIIGALALYMNFLNLFLMLLRIMGNRDNG